MALALVTVSLVAVTAIVVAVLLAMDDAGDEPDGAVSSTTPALTSSSASTTTPSSSTSVVVTTTTSTSIPVSTSPSSTTSTVPAPDPAVRTAVFPAAASAERFDDPAELATRFAADYAGFTDPIVGEFRGGDARSGEVEVRASDDGPVTTVLVRQLDEHWWVLGAVSPNIALQQPVALSPISSPVRLQGVSTAFEAAVSVEIRQDGDPAELGRGVVMGGSMGEFAAFDGTVEFAAAASPMGAIILSTSSMQDGTIREVSVVRVAFA
jgi:hypothetical protein